MLGLQRRRTKPPHAAPPQDFPCDDPVLALVRGGPDAAHRIDGGPPFQSEHRGATEPTCRIPDDHKDAYETGLAENRTSPS